MPGSDRAAGHGARHPLAVECTRPNRVLLDHGRCGPGAGRVTLLLALTRSASRTSSIEVPPRMPRRPRKQREQS